MREQALQARARACAAEVQEVCKKHGVILEPMITIVGNRIVPGLNYKPIEKVPGE